MAMRQQLREVLSIIAELAHNDINRDVYDTAVIDRIGVDEEETRDHINELIGLGHVRELLPRMNRTEDGRRREFRLIGITRHGLQELTQDQELR